MNLEEFVKEYGDVIVAYQKLETLIGVEEAEKLLLKLLARHDELHDKLRGNR
jgi:hypothetical protein